MSVKYKGEIMAKLIIIKGRPYEAKFIIKASGSLTGVDLDPLLDTGTFTLSSSGVNPCLLLSKIPMTITDAPNGEFTLTLTAEQTLDLPYDIEFGEDGYPVTASCSAVLDIDTQAEGKIFAQMPKIYVQNLGEACLV